jgi:hypothetical protein
MWTKSFGNWLKSGSGPRLLWHRDPGLNLFAGICKNPQGVDHINDVGEQDTMSVLTSGVAECCGQMGFAHHAGSGMIGTMPGTGLCRVA